MIRWSRSGSCGRDRRAEFERLAIEHGGAIYAAALRMARNREDAEDLAQETLAHAYTAFESFTTGTNFRAWTLRILTNLYLTDLRRRGRVGIISRDAMEEDSDVHQASAVQWPEPALISEALDPEIEEALAGLSEPVRLTLLLVDVEDLSYEAAASALGIPVGTVRSRLNRGREVMRESLAEYARERRQDRRTGAGEPRN